MNFSDDFERANGAPGAPWTFFGGGTWEIVDGKLVHVTGSVLDAAIIDVEEPDVYVYTPLFGAQTGQFVRFIDINNTLMVVAGTGVADGLWKIVDGVSTLLALTDAILGNARLETLCVGDTIRISSNDTIFAEYTLTAPEAALFTAPTKFGIRAYGEFSQAHESIDISRYIGNVETFPADVDINTAVNGFGINVGGEVFSRWGYDAAKRHGATEIRWQFGWIYAEDYDEPGTYPGMDLEIITDALVRASNRGLKPLVVAAYGPPFRAVQTVHVDGLHPIGSTSLTVTEDISDIVLEVGFHFIGAPGLGLGKASFYGGIITEFSSEHVIELGAATIGIIEDGTPLIINRLLYSSVAIDHAADPSAIAYANYVYALALIIEKHCPDGGAIELWNEPPWPNDFWDQRSRFYDDPEAAGVATWIYELSPLIRAVAALQNWPETVEVYSSGTTKSGGQSALNVLPKEELGPIVADELHPYAIVPETHWWGKGPSCTGVAWGIGYKCLFGSSSAPAMAVVGDPVGFRRRISECGFGGIHDDPNWYEAMKSYSIRQLVGAWSMGFEMVTFYSLADGNNLDMASLETHEPYPSLVRIGQLIRFLSSIQDNISDYTLPIIHFYEGDLPLFRVNIGPVLVFWQRASADGPPFYTPHWPDLAKVHIVEEPDSDLLVFNTTRRVHESVNVSSIGVKTLYIGAEPLVLTWKSNE